MGTVHRTRNVPFYYIIHMYMYSLGPIFFKRFDRKIIIIQTISTYIIAPQSVFSRYGTIGIIFYCSDEMECPA